MSFDITDPNFDRNETTLELMRLRSAQHLICFDLDGTLISGYMDNPGKEYDLWAVLPGVAAKLQQLAAGGVQIAIVTNQGGYAYGLVSKLEIYEKLGAAVAALGLDPSAIRIYVALSAKGKLVEGEAADWRKPGGGMIAAAMRDAGVAASNTLMVGDRPEDAEAAEAAGVKFAHRDQFFA